MVKVKKTTDLKYRLMRKLQKALYHNCWMIFLTVGLSLNIDAAPPKVLPNDTVITHFYTFIESIPFFSSDSISKEVNEVEKHKTNLQNWKDKEEYVRKNRLKSYVNSSLDTVSKYKENIGAIAIEFVSLYNKKVIEDKNACIDSLKSILRERADLRESALRELNAEIDKSIDKTSFDWKRFDPKVYYSVGALFVFLLLLIVWYVKIRRKNKKKWTGTYPSQQGNASTAIVVRRKTTSILKKQSLEDVIGNESYLKIDCGEFCDDSAVRRIYIKNTCIKEIYNLYEEDLRNPENPKEDGCMVLGRWVLDNENHEYYVSLEHVILPGDDAIFSEYELNFGGKIKLKVTDKLRKLRRETNLQYDLTCWVHSHPGLGVFFSNSDSNVQMQLKNPTHPNFLTAIVIDILTPQQEMGIFTFKRDSSLNSKSDLKKMYSLVELYKWALESEKNSFKPEDYYDTLSVAKKQFNNCHAIELSNGAVIDIGALTTEHENGLVGKVHGYTMRQGLNSLNVIATVTKDDAVPDKELIGCFVVATHCSIPTIRKVIAPYIDNINFVLVYTTTDEILTSIPINNHELCTDANYYGEQKLEDLKIWTRRKR